MRAVPVKAAAESLSLPLHEIDTFTGWSPPKPIDLIIAVSFGLKVPPRLLNYASFGGINLHPSLLPEYVIRFEMSLILLCRELTFLLSLRGPAPLQHTLLAGRTSSGITLQTLHPEHFDQGSVLAQSYFRLPNDGLCTIDELRHFVAPRAADLLLSSLRDGSFMSRGRAQIHDGARDLIHASKVTPSMAHVNWDSWSSEQILRTQRALGGVWSFFKSEPSDSPRRIQWHDLHQVSLEREDFRNASCMTAQGRLFIARAKVTETTQSPVAKSRVVLRTCDGDYVSPFSITIEGKLRCLQPVQVIKEMPLMSLS